MFRKMYTTEMSCTGKTLKKRFRAIMSKKKRGVVTAVSAAAALVIVCGAVWVNASLADKADVYGPTAGASDTFDAKDALSLVTRDIAARSENPYNSAYLDVSGKTVQEAADEAGMTLEEFIAEYELPADMRADTYETAAYNMIPTRRISEIYGMTYDELDALLKFPDFVTENTPWGEALDEVTLGSYVGTGEVLEQFKEYFGLDASVNEDTKWKEIRTIVERRDMNDRISAEREANEEE